jgi:predicted nucleotide-binding protein
MTERSKHDNPTGRSSKPLVFISHDTRDEELAEAFSKLLTTVSAGVLKSFRSSDKKGNQGLAYGVIWYQELMKKLADASVVVALLTHHSIDKPWILYEAGVAQGKLNTPVIGIAIGIPLKNANNGPFAQFQNASDDVDSLTGVVVQLLKRIPGSDPNLDAIKKPVEEFKKQTEEIMKKQAIDKSGEGEIMSQYLPKKTNKNDVFIVHGRNDGIKSEVTAFLYKMKLKPIILHEQPNQGKTVIEKLEKYGDVGAAVILFSSDDLGKYNGDNEYEPRARQNVIFEAGYFIGRLGRENTIILYEDGLRIPTDLGGYIYISLDEHKRWQVELAKDLKAGGLDIDLDDILVPK